MPGPPGADQVPVTGYDTWKTARLGPETGQDGGMNSFRPLVIGAPRTGFALLCSVLAHLEPLTRPNADLRQALLALFAARLGAHVSEGIVAVFESAGLAGDLVYNGNFRELTGGPRWAGSDRPGRACYRKYVGARGRGDLMLVVSHPVQLLHCDSVPHSHTDPGWWPDAPEFAGYSLHASIRNPAGVINSACFSLNALASEHIQRFLPPEADSDETRQDLALYKLSDLKFFDGIVRFYVDYFAKFIPVRDRYAVMRWEDLILDPVPTIQAVADAAGVPIGPYMAADIWSRLDHINLTGHHHHNYRAGKGIVGDWRNWLTNHHIERLRAAGLEEAAAVFGYAPFEPIDPASYTPFQQRLDALISRGEVYRSVVDADLFGYAFNKSNIDASAFGFRTQPWREETRIERSSFTDQALETAISDAAEAAAGRLNRLFEDLLARRYDDPDMARRSLDSLAAAHRAALRPHLPARYDATFAEAAAMVTETFPAGADRAATPRPPDRRPPQLLYSRGGINIVAHHGRFLALPQSLGPIDLDQESVEGRPGVVISDSLAVVEADVAQRLGLSG
jgi:hypothetical protein